MTNNHESNKKRVPYKEVVKINYDKPFSQRIYNAVLTPCKT